MSPMGVRLVLQLPTGDLRHVHVVAATDDRGAIAAFADRLLYLASEVVDAAPDAFSRELAYLEKQQLEARLHYALREDGDEA